MYVKAWGKLGKWPPNVLIFHPFLSPSTARCCHMLESRWDQFIYLSGLPGYEKRMRHSKMQIYLIRVVGVKGVTKNNKIPAALSGHMQRSPESTRPPSQSTSLLEVCLPSYSPIQILSTAWPLRTSQQLQTDQLGHFKLGTKVGGITFCHLQLIQNQCTHWEFGCWTLWCEKLYWTPAFP